MFVIHFLNIVNREYTLRVLKEKQEAGYELKGIKAGFIFIFEKSEKKYDYNIVAVSESAFVPMSKGDVEDFNEMARNIGWEAINKRNISIYRKPTTEEAGNLFDSVEEEKRVATSLVKSSNISFYLPAFFSLFLVFINILDLFDYNVSKIENIYHIFSIIAMAMNTVSCMLNIYMNKKFIRINKEIDKGKIKYFDNKFYAFFSVLFTLITIITIIIAFIALFARIGKIERIAMILMPIIITFGFAFTAGFILNYFVLSNAKYTKNKKILFSILTLAFAILLSEIITFMFIL